MSEWLDRILAGLGGACATLAAIHLSNGDLIRGCLELVMTAGAVWLCSPPSPRRKRLGDVLTEVQRERFMAHLRDVYGEDVQTVPNPETSGVLGDPFGTPVVWCHEYATHDPHLWPINGPRYAPALCMGHQCDNPKVHMPDAYGKVS